MPEDRLGLIRADVTRYDATANPDKYLGRVLELKACGVTGDGVPKHAVLFRWRPDRDAATTRPEVTR